MDNECKDYYEALKDNISSLRRESELLKKEISEEVWNKIKDMQEEIDLLQISFTNLKRENIRLSNLIIQKGI